MKPTEVIRAERLSRDFDTTRALDEVSISIGRGHIVGLLGANGSGKSTLLRHAVGLYLPTSGSCTTLGVPAGRLGPKDLARVGYVDQEIDLVDWMSVRQLIRYVAAHYPNWNRELERDYCRRFEVNGDSRVGTLSPGQRQKVAILIAIGFEPELLLLDEPAAALDPIARREFLDLLMEIVQDSHRTVVISSHILSDVERVVDAVVMLDRGRVICDEPLDALKERYLRARLTAVAAEPLPDLPEFDAIEVERDRRQAVIVLEHTRLADLRGFSRKVGAALETEPLSLEELYSVRLASAPDRSAAA